MQAIPLVLDEAAYSEFTQKVVITYADVIQAVSGAAISLLPGFNEATTFGAGQYVYAVFWKVVTPFAFSGANNGTLVWTVGDAGSANRYVASTDLKGSVTYQVGTIANYPYVYTAASQITATFTAATQAINLLNAGEVHLYLGIAPMNLLDL